ncbi:MAG: PIN domain-containing protein [Acidimicrobiia bacterium]|nr:PIN domain-containing protein [Acidimicrobiia bacterium]
MAAVLLDTTVLIDILRGRTGAVERLRGLRGSGDTPYVCAVNVEEVVRGLRPGEEERAATLLGGLWIAPLGLEEGRRAGAWRRDAARRGRTITQADCLVAAAAFGLGARLATGNPKDFTMAGVAVEHWPVGE